MGNQLVEITGLFSITGDVLSVTDVALLSFQIEAGLIQDETLHDLVSAHETSFEVANFDAGKNLRKLITDHLRSKHIRFQANSEARELALQVLSQRRAPQSIYAHDGTISTNNFSKRTAGADDSISSVRPLSQRTPSINRDALFKIVERMVDPARIPIRVKDLPLEDLLLYAEGAHFYFQIYFQSRWMIREDTGKDIYALDSATLKKYIDEYLAQLEHIQQIAHAPPDDLQTVGDIELVLNLHEILAARRQIKERQGTFVDTLYESGHFGDLNHIVSTFASNPSFKTFYERSFAAHQEALAKKRNRLSRELKRRKKNDPLMVQRVIQTIHNRTNDIDDTLIDRLLRQRVGKTEYRVIQEKDAYSHEAYQYGGTPYSLIRDMVKRLHLTSEDIFYDLGSGYGRVALYVAMTTPAKVKGIELVTERVAATNAIRAKLSLDQVEFIEGSVVEKDFSDGTIFYLFNPFHTETLNRVIEKLKEIAMKKRIRIVSLGECTSAFQREKSWLKSIYKGSFTIFESLYL